MPYSIAQLHEWIRKGEGEALEFKKRTTSPHRISRTLASLANTRGGRVLVGVEDNGRLAGVRDAEEESYLLRQAAAQYVDPPLPLQIDVVEDEEARVLLVVTVAESAHKPHRALIAPDDWRGYVRVGAESVQTSQLTEKVLRNEQPPAERLVEWQPLSRHEQAAVDYVRQHPRLTLNQYAKLINISKRRAHRMLIKLVLHGYLRYHDKEKEPYYTRG